tara:strand:+ start:7 stop:267 length:261 start_codon:yes stop_codon:yes gene_type:complete
MFIIYILLLQTVYGFHKAREYNRIPKNQVHERIYSFLERNGINNCYEHLEDSETILLKCYNDNELVNVEISIQSQNTNNKYISLYI